MQTALVCGAPSARTLNTWSSVEKPPAIAISGTKAPWRGELLEQLVGHALEVEGRDAPLLHHAPRAHAGAAGCAVDGEQVDLGVADAHLIAMASSRIG